jgi:hypothetical protein
LNSGDGACEGEGVRLVGDRVEGLFSITGLQKQGHSERQGPERKQFLMIKPKISSVSKT